MMVATVLTKAEKKQSQINLNLASDWILEGCQGGEGGETVQQGSNFVLADS